MYYFLRLCSLAVLFASFSSFTKHEVAWIEYFQNDLIKIETTSYACENVQAGTNKKYIFLRVTNKTQDDLKVSFQRELWYNDVCTNCNGGDETKSTIVVKAGETVEGTCGDATKDLKIFESMTNGSQRALSKFELKNVEVNTLK